VRLLIAGVPRSGKTTLAALRADEASRAGAPLEVRHTDDLIGRFDWSGASAEVATWFGRSGDWIVEGVAVGRALRKWFAARQDAPCDVVVWMPRPRFALSSGQLTMAKGCLTVWAEVEPELRRRGVAIETR